MDVARRIVEIEFLYLYLSSCGPCVASDASLRAAAGLLRPVLAEVGVTLTLRNIQVTSAPQGTGRGAGVIANDPRQWCRPRR